MNLFSRLVHQAQGHSTQLNPLSSMSRYEEPPLLEQVSLSDNRESSPVSSRNSNLHRNHTHDTDRFAQAEVVTNNDHPRIADNNSPAAVNIEDKQVDSRIEESVIKYSVPLLSPHQEKAINLSQDNVNTQMPSVNEPVMQKTEQITAFPNTETQLNQDREKAAININLYQPDTVHDTWQNTEPVRKFQPLLQKTTPSNRHSDLTVSVDTGVQSNIITPAPVEVHVSIGSIEVKGQQQTTLPINKNKSKTKTKASMSLAAYLAKREAGKR